MDNINVTLILIVMVMGVIEKLIAEFLIRIIFVNRKYL